MKGVMKPRWCWAPFKKAVVRDVHTYILDGMIQAASARQSYAVADRDVTPCRLMYPQIGVVGTWYRAHEETGGSA